jgi:pyruvyl transferase EpsI
MYHFISKIANDEDIIAISGGGWLGDTWEHNEDFVRLVIYSFPDNKIVVFPQTSFYEFEDGYLSAGIRIYSQHKKLFFCAREQATYEYYKKKCFVPDERMYMLPDMALFSNIWHDDLNVSAKNKNTSPKIALYLRSDRETILNESSKEEIYDAVQKYSDVIFCVSTNETGRRILPVQRRRRIIEKMKEISEYDLLITDGLHAMIIAAITGTPCIVLDNLTHKVRGVYEWISALDYIMFLPSTENIDSAVGDMVEHVFVSVFHDLNYSKYRHILVGLLD